MTQILLGILCIILLVLGFFSLIIETIANLKNKPYNYTTALMLTLLGAIGLFLYNALK